MLARVGAEDAAAVQIGGPSGTMIGRDMFHRRLCFEDLPTGGAIIVFSPQRSILEIVDYYMSFFIEESCGYCTPCRVGNIFLKRAIEKFRAGQADESDIAYMRSTSQPRMSRDRWMSSSLMNAPPTVTARIDETSRGSAACSCASISW